MRCRFQTETLYHVYHSETSEACIYSMKSQSAMSVLYNICILFHKIVQPQSINIFQKCLLNGGV